VSVVVFPDGAQETFNPLTVTYNQATGVPTVAWNLPTTNPWFSQHANPSAGIRWNPDNQTLDYYFSVA
jgi:hypothetical protein